MDFLTLSFYTNPTPGANFPLGYALLVFFALVCFFGPLITLMGPKNRFFKKSLKKKFWAFPILGVIGIILVLARFSNVPYFASRLWLALVLALTIVVGTKVKWNIFTEYNKRRNSYIRDTKKPFGFFQKDDK